MDEHPERRNRLRRLLQKTGAEALLVTNFTNVTYLTGFTGEDNYLLVCRDGGELLISDPRYTTQLAEECPQLDLSIRRPAVSLAEAVVKALKLAKIRRLAVEADSMTISLQGKLIAGLPKTQIIPTCGQVEQLRQIKDRGEIERIRRAVWLAEKAFGMLRAGMRPEKTERELCIELEHQMRLFGARWRAFPSIVGVGSRAALPHAPPTNRRIAESQFVLVDWGADEGLYKSDLTRVVVTGRISPKLRRVYGVVLRAQARAIAAIRPGAAAREVDRVARGLIADAGFGRYFGHGLGHGVGLEVHEAPRLASNSDVVLRPGMVVTVEPGVYVPGWGGVRIEDDVLVTRSGHEVLSSVAKQLSQVVLD